MKCTICGKEISDKSKIGLCRSCINRQRWNDPDYRKRCSLKMKESAAQGNETRKKNSLEKYGVEYYWQTEEAKEAIRKKKLEKYGDENYNNPEKNKITCLKKYGVDHPLKSNQVRQKLETTCLEKYGTKYAFQSNDVKLKIKDTFNRKYGVDCLLSSESPIRKKIDEIMKNRSNEEKRKSFIKAGQTRKKLRQTSGLFCDSLWEQEFVKTHPGCKRGPLLKYSMDGKDHDWFVDFEWEGHLYEVKNPYMLRDDCKWNWKNNRIKFASKKVRWYLWNPGTLGSFETEEWLSEYILNENVLDKFLNIDLRKIKSKLSIKELKDMLV
jgi:hypothetical protein